MTWAAAAWTLFTAWLVATAGMLLRSLFPNVLYEPQPEFTAGRRSDFPEVGKVYEEFKQSQGVWLVRLIENRQDRLVALAAVCTHLGCTPNWFAGEQCFKCPCHGTAFYENGVNFVGPAPRPLERYRIYLDAGGSIIVDKSRKYRKELGQGEEPGAFVAMG